MSLRKSLSTQYSTNQWFHSATPNKFLSVKDIWFPTGVSTLCHCHVVGSSGQRFLLGWVGRLSLWSCFVETEFEQPVIDLKAELQGFVFLELANWSLSLSIFH